MFELGPHTKTEHPQWRGHNVTLICGPPGSGKSTLAEHLHRTTLDIGEMPAGTARDRMRRFGRAAWRIGRTLNPDAAVVRGAPTAKERQHLQGLCRPERTIILTTPAALCHERVDARNRRGTDGRDVADQHRAIDNWWQAWRADSPTAPPPVPSPYNTARWHRLRKQIVQLGAQRHERCGLCGQAIDYRLPGSHRDGPTVDHRVPTSRGGSMWDLANLQLAHRRCNSAQGAHLTNNTYAPPTHTRQPALTSRQW